MFFLLFLLLLFLAGEIAVAGQKLIYEDPQFWVTVALVLTFMTDMVRRAVQRRWDKQDRTTEKAEEKTERIEVEEQAKKEREQIAVQIKNELKYQHDIDERERLRASNAVVKKIDEQKNTVDEIKEKIVTLSVADDHKEEIKHTIEDTAKVTAQKADAINRNLEELKTNGLLNKD